MSTPGQAWFIAAPPGVRHAATGSPTEDGVIPAQHLARHCAETRLQAPPSRRVRRARPAAPGEPSGCPHCWVLNADGETLGSAAGDRFTVMAPDCSMAGSTTIDDATIHHRVEHGGGGPEDESRLITWRVEPRSTICWRTPTAAATARPARPFGGCTATWCAGRSDVAASSRSTRRVRGARRCGLLGHFAQNDQFVDSGVSRMQKNLGDGARPRPDPGMKHGSWSRSTRVRLAPPSLPTPDVAFCAQPGYRHDGIKPSPPAAIVVTARTHDRRGRHDGPARPGDCVAAVIGILHRCRERVDRLYPLPSSPA